MRPIRARRRSSASSRGRRSRSTTRQCPASYLYPVTSGIAAPYIRVCLGRPSGAHSHEYRTAIARDVHHDRARRSGLQLLERLHRFMVAAETMDGELLTAAFAWAMVLVGSPRDITSKGRARAVVSQFAIRKA